MKLQAFIASLSAGARPGSLKTAARSILYKRDKTIRALLEASSPYDPDKKKGRHFRDNWKVKRIRFGARNVLAGLAITNTTPKYGVFVASGASPGKAPWYYPHTKTKSGRVSKGTGKLTVHDGKVWAGGLNPGHSKTIGGPIAQIMEDYTNKFAREFADEFIKKGFI